MQIIPINQYSMTSVSIHEDYELIHVRKDAKLFGFFSSIFLQEGSDFSG